MLEVCKKSEEDQILIYFRFAIGVHKSVKNLYCDYCKYSDDDDSGNY